MAPIAGFHLHFYQPPRENPWLGLVENEWSAWPYHDWNERIAAECYRAMIAVALPGEEGAGTELFEPLGASSFDVGPTLHSWLDVHAPDVARALRHQVHELAASTANGWSPGASWTTRSASARHRWASGYPRRRSTSRRWRPSSIRGFATRS